MFKKIILIIGVTLMSLHASGADLKPSQIKSLESQIKKIQKDEDLLNKPTSLSDMEMVRKRTRDLDKIKKSLDRITKALGRFPENSAVTEAMNKLEKAKNLLNEKRTELDKGRDSTEGINQAQKDQLEAIVSSQEIKDDVEMVDYLKNVLLNSGIEDTNENPSIDLLENIVTRIQSTGAAYWAYTESTQENVDEKIVALKYADKIIAASESLIKQFHTLPINNYTQRGYDISDSILKHFKWGVANTKKGLPLTIAKAAKDFKSAFKEEFEGHNRAVARTDSSYLSSESNPYGWFNSHKMKLRVLIQYHKALNLDNHDEMLKIQEDALAYANKLSKEIRDYQVEHILPNQDPKWNVDEKTALEKSKKQIEDYWQWGIKDREKLTKELLMHLERRSVRKKVIQEKIDALPVKL